ncbi:hypothetical protein KUH32_16045 [Thalassococcus sp. CAU 1522]|uniref:Tetratricopeptide repeat-like domain-containing protein n=1 Tax=Thalassococcus arenae TaxID=2851652 RepID=A0ABS6NC75_9RHOB|nr:hypothetical protein [Thalassococcus arenae]MBV2361277.1 hypothetical protein [Thalassococcus arenae]
MSNSDSFIEEVTEEVRRDRLFALMRRYGWIAILAVLLLVGGAAWRELRLAQDRATAQAFGDSLLAALEADDPAQRLTALAGVEADEAAARALRDMLAAAEAQASGDTAAAAALLQGVADDGAVPAIYRQIAQFKALSGASDDLDPATRRAGLQALATPGQPLRALAEEQLAILDIEEGATDAALTRLQALMQDAEATAGLRRRATQLIVALGGTPDEG